MKMPRDLSGTEVAWRLACHYGCGRREPIAPPSVHGHRSREVRSSVFWEDRLPVSDVR